MSRRAVVFSLLATAVVSVPILIYFAPAFAGFLYGIVFFFAPLWLPVLLFLIAWPLWLSFIRSRFTLHQKYVTLELIPGTETPASARAMELVFYSLYQRTDISRTDQYLKGRIPHQYSFEVYAHGGSVRFFVHAPLSHRLTLEARIRAEYRDVDIHEVRDYSREIAFNPFSMKLVMREYTLEKPDPYPLRTYVSYEENEKAPDIFGEVVESLGQVGSEEHVLVSFIIRPHQRERRTFFAHPTDSLHESARTEIRKLVGSSGEMQTLAPATKRIVGAIEHALQKPSFDCGIRALYIADSGHFNTAYTEKLSHLFSPFNDSELNSFGAYDPTDKTGVVLSEVFRAAPILVSSHFLTLFRRRAFFAPPYIGTQFVLNTEELATVFHLPHARRGSALSRMRGAALLPPENLPV